MTDAQSIATLITTSIGALVSGYLAVRRQVDGRRLKQHSSTLETIKRDVNSNMAAANTEIRILRKEARAFRKEAEAAKQKIAELQAQLKAKKKPKRK